eukprot:1192980-Prorocentrum_minimum.AAC.2
MVRKLLSDYMDSAEGAHGDSAREALRILDGILDDIDATSRSGSDEKKREAGGGASKVSSGVWSSRCGFRRAKEGGERRSNASVLPPLCSVVLLRILDRFLDEVILDAASGEPTRREADGSAEPPRCPPVCSVRALRILNGILDSSALF